MQRSTRNVQRRQMFQHWISSAVIYQVNLRSLAAREPRNAVEAARESRNADGGTRSDEFAEATSSPLRYLTQSLEAVRDLGVNVLYLMPLYPIGREGRKGIGSPYSIRDFTDVDPEFGTKADLGELVRRAHALGLRVILDITPNHTARDHVWTGSHPEYYVKTPRGDIHYDCDWSDTAKMDYRNAGLRGAMAEVYRHWLSFPDPGEGLDGFRLDMAHFINDLSFWNEAVPRLRAGEPGRDILFLAECYGARNNKDLFARGINAAYDDDFYKFCQYFYGVDEAGGSVIAPAPEAAGNPDFRETWDAFQRGGLAGAMERVLTAYDDTGSADGGPWLARYTDNHDEGRGLYRFGAGAVKAANRALFLAARSLPFLLTGQEFGAVNRPSIHERFGPCDKGRRVFRGGQSLRVDPGVEFEGNLFARGAAARREWRDFYRDLIRLRLDHPALTQGSMRLLDVGEDCPPRDRAVVAFERQLGDSTLRCAINLGPEERNLKRADAIEGETVYGAMDRRSLAGFAAVVTRG